MTNTYRMKTPEEAPVQRDGIWRYHSPKLHTPINCISRLDFYYIKNKSVHNDGGIIAHQKIYKFLIDSISQRIYD